MQKICQVPGGLPHYLEAPDCLVNEQTRACPFCKDGHRLRLHGWYDRRVVFPGESQEKTIPVLRLLCSRKRRTLSLLPDFCLPRRQHSAGLLGLFLLALVRGQSLLSAMREVRPSVPGHSVPQALLRGFLDKAGHLRTYLASLWPRPPVLPLDVPRKRHDLARLVFGLREGFHCVISAFEHHGRVFHTRYAMAIA